MNKKNKILFPLKTVLPDNRKEKNQKQQVGSLSASRQGGDYQQVGMRDMNASRQGEVVLTTTRLADGMDEG